jgi:hypothetical protein
MAQEFSQFSYKVSTSKRQMPSHEDAMLQNWRLLSWPVHVLCPSSEGTDKQLRAGVWVTREEN